METIRIIGVPEHFNYAWEKVVESQPFLDEEIKLEWQNESRGSGEMNKAIRAGDAAIAIVLTESFVKDKIEGNPGSIIGFHVKSPLIWGIHVSGKSKVTELRELKNAPFLISRFGSGSHLMAFLLAEREKWDLKGLEFEVIGNMEGAKRSFQSEIPKTFLWEKYTTKPFVDNGSFKRVGEIPTPWPCFVIVASDTAIQKHREMLRKLRDLVYEKSITLRADPDFPIQLSHKYGILLEDVQAWLSQTHWAEDSQIDLEVFENTMNILKRLGLIQKKIKSDDFVFKPLVEVRK
jgi:ABC-type nitrate/sulfonate/bicarbonate transport system substrate-binding protein